MGLVEGGATAVLDNRFSFYGLLVVMVVVVPVLLWLVVAHFTSLQMVSSLITLAPTLLIVIVVFLNLFALIFALRDEPYV